ncbi:MAG: nuclear transport factor 2 family protein [Erythrobacter sp.]
MADIEAEIETLETRLMRAWMAGGTREVKTLMAADAIVMFGTNPPDILDRPSFVAAVESGLVLDRYRFGTISARRHGRSAWFTAQVDLELRIGGREWKGAFLMSDLWIKGRVRRGWRLVERSLASLDQDERRSAAIRSLQLWR